MNIFKTPATYYELAFQEARIDLYLNGKEWGGPVPAPTLCSVIKNKTRIEPPCPPANTYK